LPIRNISGAVRRRRRRSRTTAAASSGSKPGPTNPALTDAVKQRIDALRAADPDNTAPVPVDLVTASVAAWIRTSPGGGAVSDRARREGTRRAVKPRSPKWSRKRPKAASSACSASRVSTCFCSTSLSTEVRP
jgi:hypothetical protein